MLSASYVGLYVARMIRLFIILWPALLPLFVYVGWCIMRYRRKQAGEAVPAITKPLFHTLIAMIVIGMGCFVIFGAQQPANEGKGYHPAVYKDGVLVPGGISQ